MMETNVVIAIISTGDSIDTKNFIIVAAIKECFFENEIERRV